MKRKALLLFTALFLATAAVWGQNSFTQGATKGYKIKMNVGEHTGATYQWRVLPAEGTSSDLSVVSVDTATIVWDGPVGVYTLAVQVTDGNGCLSEPITQTVEIQAQGDLIFAATYPGTMVCSDLAGGNDGSVNAHSQSSFMVTYTGSANLLSANITIKNPAGEYVDLNGAVLPNQGTPEVTITNAEADKEILFSVTDSWENTSAANEMFEVKLVNGKTADNTEITANQANDVSRNISVLPKPVIAFE